MFDGNREHMSVAMRSMIDILIRYGPSIRFICCLLTHFICRDCEDANERSCLISGIIGESETPDDELVVAVRNLFDQIFVDELRVASRISSSSTTGYTEASFVQSFFAN